MFKLKNLIFSFLAVVITATAVFGFILKQHYVVPIIMYHSVTPIVESKNRLAVTVDTFERQMRFLKEHKYQVLPLEQLAMLIKEKKKIPSRAIAITFDDGYKDNYFYALPVLKKYQLPATLFIIVNEVGRPQNDRLSWDQIKQMQSSGEFCFGSHAMGPDPLFKAGSGQELKYEIFNSKKILEEKLGIPVTIFSYPEGMFDDKIRQLVIDAGYKAAVATKPGRDYPSDDTFALKRLRISENSRNLFIFAIETSGFYTFLKEKKRK